LTFYWLQGRKKAFQPSPSGKIAAPVFFVPVFHAMHNVFTACIPLDLLGRIRLCSISDRLYF
jgi:hypothetical protein